MIRATMTILLSAMIMVLFMTPALLLSLIYPQQWFGAFIARIWVRIVLWMAGVKLTIEGLKHVSDGVPRFFVGNHQSSLDIPILLYGLRGYIRFLAKKSLFRIPIFGWFMTSYGYIPIDRKNPRATFRTVNKMLDRLRTHPSSFAIYPEGTRSTDGQLLPFRRGSMKIVQRAGLDIVPFSIDGSGRVYGRDTNICHPGPVKLVFGKPIPANEVANMTPTELRDHVRLIIARQLGQSGDYSITENMPVLAAESA